MFSLHVSSSSSEDEGFWPPPGRRRRHPAGDRRDDNCSTSSEECVSKFFTISIDSNSAVQLNATSHIPINLERNDTRRNYDSRFQLSSSSYSSSGVFSHPADQSFHSNGIPYSPLFLNDSMDGTQNLTDNWEAALSSRFNFCNFDTDENSVKNSGLTSLELPKDEGSSPPLMLKRFLNTQFDHSDISRSLPSVRFQNCTVDDS